MTIGDKIRKYRNLRGLTQEELGKRVGLQRDRIRQYETNVRTPKADLLKKIADQLDIDVSALSDVDIRDEVDLMHVLFDAEDTYGIDVVKKDGKTMLVFDDTNIDHSVITTYLSLWCDKRRTLGIAKDNSKRDEYLEWQGQFGTQAESFKTEIMNRIDKKYASYVNNASPKAGSTTSIVHVLRKLEPGILIDTAYNNGNPGLVFDADKILNEESENFAEFLIKMKSIMASGGNILTDVIYDGSQIKIAYFFPYAAFSVITSFADDLISYNKERDTYSSIAKEEYEKKLDSDMKLYDLDIDSILNEHKK